MIKQKIQATYKITIGAILMTINEPSNKDLGSLTPLEKYALVFKTRIYHPHFMEVVNAMRECHLETKETGIPHCILITGEEGRGKTELWKYYKAKYNGKSDEGKFANKRILSVEIPKMVSRKSLIQQLLKEVGDYHYQRGTLQTALERLKNYIPQCGVEVILVDEFHHFLNLSKNTVLSDTADFFKTIVNFTGCSVMLFGTPESSRILEENGQFFRRAPYEERIDAFGYKTKDEKQQFRKLLHEYEKILPFSETTNLSSALLSKKIHLATNGIMFNVSALIARATKEAAKEGASSIHERHFAKAYKHNKYLQRNSENTFTE